MSEHEIQLTVNDAHEELTVESRTLLVHALRDDLGYTGPNVGCESGKCGACTVHLDGEAVKSCTVLAVQADGKEVTTVEGVGDDGLTPIQESFREEHGLQCGYCTPGMVMTTDRLLAAAPDPSRDEIRSALKGNVCRCTGYQNIVNAVERAAQRASSEAGDAVESAAEKLDIEDPPESEESTSEPQPEATPEAED